MENVVYFEAKLDSSEQALKINDYVDDVDHNRIMVLSITYVEAFGNYAVIKGTGIVLG